MRSLEELGLRAEHPTLRSGSAASPHLRTHCRWGDLFVAGEAWRLTRWRTRLPAPKAILLRRATVEINAMNRIWKYLNEEKPDEEQPVARDYWVVRCYGATWHVRAPHAMRIKRVLERRWRPTWLEFRDVAGSRVCVRTAHVIEIYEYTEKQRAKHRRHGRYLKDEAPDDKNPWDDDCW
jgi:hypothetical protein